MKFEALLFDIDNTLVLYDEAAFFKQYFSLLGQSFGDMMPAEAFLGKAMKATQAMLKTKDNDLSNAQYFLDVFTEGERENQAEIWRRFLAFYENEYDQMQQIMRPAPGIPALFSALAEKEMILVGATNPVFPPLAQEKRLHWAGVDPAIFQLVTNIENTTVSKPNPAFYQEICDKIEIAPQDCLMIGNDPVNDLSAAKIGMRTYLATDSHSVEGALAISHSLGKKAVSEIRPDYEGPLLDVLKILD